MSKRTQTHYYINGKSVSLKDFEKRVTPITPKTSLEKALDTYNAFMKNDCVTSKNVSYA